MSIEEDWMKEFDRLIQNRGYRNRSAAIRQGLISQIVEKNIVIVGTLTIFFL